MSAEYVTLVWATRDHSAPWFAYTATVDRGTIESYSPESTHIRVMRPTARWAYRAADWRRRRMESKQSRSGRREARARRVTGYGR